MRQGQQNRRGRGRHNGGGGHGGGNYNNNNNNNNNNNRKGQNPLARSYESNGPDVKIRGNPAHIAEKYLTLARDAQSTGDSVLAESYLQHAEHYNRIIMAYREQQQQSGEGQFRPRQQPGEQAEGMQDGDEDGDDQGQGGADMAIRGQEPQPGMFDPPRERFTERSPDQGNREDRPQRNFDDRQQRRQDGNREGNRDGNRDGGRRERYGEGQRFSRDDRPRDDRPRDDRQDRPERRERFDRYQDRDRPQGERGYQERQPQQERPIRHDRPPQDTSERSDRPERITPERVAPEPHIAIDAPAAAAPIEAEVPVTREPAAPTRRRAPANADRFVEGSNDQPEFLRRPVRRPRRETAAAPVEPASSDDETGKE